jgi:intein-encoded DNA endonuclease-like protein
MAYARRARREDAIEIERCETVAKGMDIEIVPLDEDHVRAKITWSEQDVGGGKLVVEVTVKNRKSLPKTDDQLKSDARALAVRFARAFADTVEN